MFSDPISITVAGSGKSLARISTTGNSSSYATSDDLWRLTISHQKAANNHLRSLVRFEQRKVITNPLDSTKSAYDFESHSYVYDRPEVGFTLTDGTDMLTGFKTWLDTTVFGKVHGRET